MFTNGKDRRIKVVYSSFYLVPESEKTAFNLEGIYGKAMGLCYIQMIKFSNDYDNKKGYG
jgi:hypothetical protein